MNTKIVWMNREGKFRAHSLGGQFTYTHALDWFRRSIEECQGVLSVDEKRTTQLKLLRVENFLPNNS